jgi:hypothetical protein
LSGIHVRRAVLFGSHVRGTATLDSDIDLVVVAPEFDEPRDDRWVDLLWESRGVADWRIEPFPCGERQWETDDASPILEIARREGEPVGR